MSSNFANSYKIPRRQGNTDGLRKDPEKEPVASTSSPLSRKATTGKNNVVPKQPVVKTLPAPVNKPHAQPRERNSLHPHKNQQSSREDVHNKQKAVKRQGCEMDSIPPPPPQKQSRPNKDDDPMELLDRIWKEMDEDDTRRKKSEELQQDGSASPSASPFLQAATPIPSANTLKLTRHELLAAPKDDTIFQSFLNKPGLMERILGYKMQNSKVDSYEIMKKIARLDECERVEDDDVDYGIPPCHRIEEPSTSFAKQGPKTPPGSPNHDHETEDAILSADEWHNRSLRSTSSRHSDLKISSPPLEPPLDDNEFTSRAELLQTFSQATNTPVEKLEELIGSDIQHAIGRVAKSVLLNTLKNAIRDVSSNSPKPTPLPNRLEADVTVQSPILSGSSTESNASSEKSFTLPPPPPAPENIDEEAVKSSTNTQQSRTQTVSTSTGFKRSFNEPTPIQLITSVPPPKMPTIQKNAFPWPDLSKPPPSRMRVPVFPLLDLSRLTPLSRIRMPVLPLPDLSRPPPNLYRPPPDFPSPRITPSPASLRVPYQPTPLPYNRPPPSLLNKSFPGLTNQVRHRPNTRFF